MDKKRVWLMTKQQLNTFHKHRMRDYKDIMQRQNLDKFEDLKLQTFYLKNMLRFLRKRKINADQQFKFQKVIYTSVSLFKKYYLVKSFIDEEPTQSMICSIYLSLKINEYDDQDIQKYAQVWKQKPIFEPNRDHLHMGDEGYTQKQLMFLQGFGFQVGKTSLIQPIESLYMRLKLAKVQKINELLTYIKNTLDKIYLDTQLLFLYDGPKIGLVIVVLAMKELEIDTKYLGTDIIELIARHSKQIYQLVDLINKIPVYDQKKAIQFDKIDEMRKKTKTKFQRPQPKKSPSFKPIQSFLFDKQ